MLRFKMDFITKLRKEHLEIGYLLISLENLMVKDNLDLRKIKAVFENLSNLIHKHESEEDPFFSDLHLEDKEFNKLVDEIEKVHLLIKGHLEVLRKAFSSNNYNFIRASFENDGRMLFSKLREHMYNEERIFDFLLFFNLNKEKIELFNK